MTTENKKKVNEPSVNSNLKKLSKKRKNDAPRKIVVRDADGTLNTIKTCNECRNKKSCPMFYDNKDRRMVRCTEFA